MTRNFDLTRRANVLDFEATVKPSGTLRDGQTVRDSGKLKRIDVSDGCEPQTYVFRKSPFRYGAYGRFYIAKRLASPAPGESWPHVSNGIVTGDYIGIKEFQLAANKAPVVGAKLAITPMPDLVREAQLMADIDAIHRPSELLHNGTSLLCDGTQTKAYMMQRLLACNLNEVSLTDLHTPAIRCLALLRGLTPALRDLHARHFVHRDIKPHNILVELEHPVTNGYPGQTTPAFVFSDYGQTVPEAEGYRGGGTEKYRAPEQSGSGAVTAKADVYAFAKTVLAKALGTSPLIGAREEPVCRVWRQRHAKVWTATLPGQGDGPGRSIESVVADMKQIDAHEGLGALLDGMLLEDPAKRLSSADVFERLVVMALPEGFDDALRAFWNAVPYHSPEALRYMHELDLACTGASAYPLRPYRDFLAAIQRFDVTETLTSFHAVTLRERLHGPRRSINLTDISDADTVVQNKNRLAEVFWRLWHGQLAPGQIANLMRAAAELGRFNVLEVLLLAGASLEGVPPRQRDELFLKALEKKRRAPLSTLKALLLHVAPTDQRVLDKALARAWAAGHHALLSDLLDRGARANQVDAVSGNDLFFAAVVKGDVISVALFLSNGFNVVNPSADGRWLPVTLRRSNIAGPERACALSAAVVANKPEVAKTILRARPELNTPDVLNLMGNLARKLKDRDAVARALRDVHGTDFTAITADDTAEIRTRLTALWKLGQAKDETPVGSKLEPAVLCRHRWAIDAPSPISLEGFTEAQRAQFGEARQELLRGEFRDASASFRKVAREGCGHAASEAYLQRVYALVALGVLEQAREELEPLLDPRSGVMPAAVILHLRLSITMSDWSSALRSASSALATCVEAKTVDALLRYRSFAQARLAKESEAAGDETKATMFRKGACDDFAAVLRVSTGTVQMAGDLPTHVVKHAEVITLTIN